MTVTEIPEKKSTAESPNLESADLENNVAIGLTTTKAPFIEESRGGGASCSSVNRTSSTATRTTTPGGRLYAAFGAESGESTRTRSFSRGSISWLWIRMRCRVSRT